MENQKLMESVPESSVRERDWSIRRVVVMAVDTVRWKQQNYLPNSDNVGEM
jgi:hypothetical protein